MYGIMVGLIFELIRVHKRGQIFVLTLNCQESRWQMSARRSLLQPAYANADVHAASVGCPLARRVRLTSLARSMRHSS